MIESTSAKVHPNEEIDMIRTYEQFGWVLKSNQEIRSENSHIENSGGSLYSVTEKTHYINLMFQRDTSIPNYKQLTELEEKYWSIINSEPYVETYGIIWGILTIIGIIFYVLPGAAIIAFRVRKIKKSKQLHAEWAEKSNHDIPEIRNMCLQLL